MLLFILTLVSLHLYAVIEPPDEIISFRQNPSGLNWRKIDTENFEVIFPAEVEAEAQRVTHLLELSYPLVTRSLESLPERISIILQNQSTISNGFVTLAPRRSELFLTPALDPELSNTEWLKTLAVHEFRHVVQFQKSRQHFNKVYEILLGEIGHALGLGLAAPPWFYEGDAVGIETALTFGGRGRLPLFERDLRALLLTGERYSYDKAHLGSFADYVPNHYLYGYFYTTFMRLEEGDLFLSRLLDEATQRSYNPLTFYNAYESLTGREFEEFYRLMIQKLIRDWSEKESKLKLTPYTVKNLDQRDGFTNYLYPNSLGDGRYLALKQGLSHFAQFVITDGKNDELLFFPGVLQQLYPYKLRSGRLALVEKQLDTRWQYRDFSRIRVFDFNQKDFIADIPGTKGRLAILDHSGEFILYVDWDEEQNQRIKIVDLNGLEVVNLNFPSQEVITSLDWIDEKNIVMVIKDHADFKSVVKINLETHSREELLARSRVNLGFLYCEKGRVLIESPQSGIDNIFELKQGQLTQLTSSRFGAYAPSFDGERLIYSDYSAQGMNIVEKQLSWDEAQSSGDSFISYYEELAQSEGLGEIDKNIFKQKTYPSSKYSELKGALNLHSWIILAPPLSNTLSFLGLSRDLLNNFTLSAGASYQLDERKLQGVTSATWSHFYPVMDLGAAYGGRRSRGEWEEGTLEAGVSVPWQKISGRFFQSFSARAFGRLIKVTNKVSGSISEITDGGLFSPGVELRYSALSRTAKRDLFPEWGLSTFTQIEKGEDFTGKSMSGSLFSSDTRFYLPGLWKHHSFYHQLAYEHQRDESYRYASLISRPRGVLNVFYQESFKYSGNYTLPLAYPDWELSRYFYLKRLALNVFYDEENGRYRNSALQAASTGGELLLDSHLLRIFIPITIGIRGSYVLRGLEKRDNYEIFITTLNSNFD
jgi:hypothetical protein